MLELCREIAAVQLGIRADQILVLGLNQRCEMRPQCGLVIVIGQRQVPIEIGADANLVAAYAKVSRIGAEPGCRFSQLVMHVGASERALWQGWTAAHALIEAENDVRLIPASKQDVLFNILQRQRCAGDSDPFLGPEGARIRRRAALLLVAADAPLFGDRLNQEEVAGVQPVSELFVAIELLDRYGRQIIRVIGKEGQRLGMCHIIGDERATAFIGGQRTDHFRIRVGIDGRRAFGIICREERFRRRGQGRGQSSERKRECGEHGLGETSMRHNRSCPALIFMGHQALARVQSRRRMKRNAFT